MHSAQWDAWGRLMQTFGNTTSIREFLRLMSLAGMPDFALELFPQILLQQDSYRAAVAHD